MKHSEWYALLFKEVKTAICRAKNNKAPGLDSITNKLLKNGGGDDLIYSLTDMFNRFLFLENSPVDWNKGIIVPIFKKGNKNVWTTIEASP